MQGQGNYGKVTDEVIVLLSEVIGGKNVLTGDERENYSWDETPGSKPVLPASAVPVYDGIVLSSERMNRILDIDDDNFVATVEPGVTLSEGKGVRGIG